MNFSREQSLADEDHRHTSGRSKKRYRNEVELEDYLKRNPLPDYVGLDRKWWIAFKGNRPTWNLICHLEFNPKPGLLLVDRITLCDLIDPKHMNQNNLGS